MEPLRVTLVVNGQHAGVAEDQELPELRVEVDIEVRGQCPLCSMKPRPFGCSEPAPDASVGWINEERVKSASRQRDDAPALVIPLSQVHVVFGQELLPQKFSIGIKAEQVVSITGCGDQYTTGCRIDFQSGRASGRERV